MVRWWYYPLTKNMSGMLLILLFMLVLIAYAVYRIYINKHNISDQSPYDDSIETLNRRLVRGEIDEEEYKQRKETMLKR